MGWNGSDRRGNSIPVQPKVVAKKPSPIRGLIAGGAVVALAVVAYFVFFTGTDKPQDEKTDRGRGRIKEVPSKKYRPVDEISPVKKRKTYENAPKNADEALARVEESQEPIKIKRAPWASDKPIPERIFKTGPEQLLSWMCHVEPGEMPPPIPPITGDDYDNIVGILISANKVTEDDDEKTAAMKQTVDAAKKQMLDFLKQGGDPNDFMKYYQSELRKAFEKRSYATELYEELDDEDPAMAREFARKVNAQFEEEGIKGIFYRKEQPEAENQGEVNQ